LAAPMSITGAGPSAGIAVTRFFTCALAMRV
jgi:hypothetical protein